MPDQFQSNDPAVQAKIASMQQQAIAKSTQATPQQADMQKTIVQSQQNPGQIATGNVFGTTSAPGQMAPTPVQNQALTVTADQKRQAGIAEVARLNGISPEEATQRYDRASAPPPVPQGTVYDPATGKTIDPRTGMQYVGSINPNAPQGMQGVRFVDPNAQQGTQTGALPPGAPGTSGAAGATGLSGTGQTLDASQDPRMKILEDVQKQNESRYNALQQQINQSFQQREAALQQQQKSETGQTSMTLARMGALGTSGSGVSYMNSLESQHQGAISQLESQRQSALMDAENEFSKESVEMAFKKLDVADNIAKQAQALQDQRLDNMMKYNQIQKMERANFDDTIDQFVEGGVTEDDLPEGYFAAQEQAAGLPKGTGKLLFDSAQKAYEVKQNTASKKDKIETQKLALETAKSIYDTLDKVPSGQMVNIAGSTYFGTQGAGKVEIDEEGVGRMMTVDQSTGKIGIKNLGKMGKAEPGQFDVQYDETTGQPYVFNKKTGQFTNTSDDYAVSQRWQQMIPDGANGGQCGTFTRKLTGLADPKTGLIPDKIEGKIALCDPALMADKSQIQIGDTFVMSTGKPWGHIGLINSIDTLPNGKTQLTLTESNWHNDEKVTNTRTMLMDDPRIKGFAPTHDKLPKDMISEGYNPSTGPRHLTAQDKAQAAAKTKREEAMNEVLSPSEAEKLGVSYGTTRADAAKQGITPGAAKAGITVEQPSEEEFMRNWEQQAVRDPSQAQFNPEQAKHVYRQTIGAIPSILDAADNVTTKLTDKKAPIVVNQIKQSIQNGEYERAKDTLKKVSLDTADSTTSQQVRGRDNSLRSLDNIEKALDEYKAKGGRTNILSGNVEDIKKKIGKVNDPELRRIANQIQSAIIDYRHAVSGAGFSVSEAQQYSDLFPSILNEEKLNKANIEGLRNTFNQGNETFYRQQLGNENYDAIFGNQ